MWGPPNSLEGLLSLYLSSARIIFLCVFKNRKPKTSLFCPVVVSFTLKLLSVEKDGSFKRLDMASQGTDQLCSSSWDEESASVWAPESADHPWERFMIKKRTSACFLIRRCLKPFCHTVTHQWCWSVLRNQSRRVLFYVELLIFFLQFFFFLKINLSCLSINPSSQTALDQTVLHVTSAAKQSIKNKVYGSLEKLEQEQINPCSN